MAVMISRFCTRKIDHLDSEIKALQKAAGGIGHVKRGTHALKVRGLRLLTRLLCMHKYLPGKESELVSNTAATAVHLKVAIIGER